MKMRAVPAVLWERAVCFRSKLAIRWARAKNTSSARVAPWHIAQKKTENFFTLGYGLGPGSTVVETPIPLRDQGRRCERVWCNVESSKVQIRRYNLVQVRMGMVERLVFFTGKNLGHGPLVGLFWSPCWGLFRIVCCSFFGGSSSKFSEKRLVIDKNESVFDVWRSSDVIVSCFQVCTASCFWPKQMLQLLCATADNRAQPRQQMMQLLCATAHHCAQPCQHAFFADASLFLFEVIIATDAPQLLLTDLTRTVNTRSALGHHKTNIHQLSRT